MKLRIASFNTENLFSRARALNHEDNAENKAILNDIVALDGLIAKENYTQTQKDKMVEIIMRQGAHKSEKTRPFYIQQVREKLYSVSHGQVVIKANGRSDWAGWIELDRDLVPQPAVENTARVLQKVDADVVCLVEVEDRITLQRFCDEILHKDEFVPAGGKYGYNMLIDGNDPRGIDVAILSRYEIGTMKSHIHDKVGNSRTFSRDCPEYEVKVGGRSLWLLCNHLKSQGYGSKAANDARRKRQAEAVRAILDAGYDLTRDLVVVAGDMNDTPQSAPLAPLATAPNLHDALDRLAAGKARFTYTSKKQIDCVFVSEPLWNGLREADVEREGMYSKTNFGGLVTPFGTVTGPQSAASDHGAVWAEFQI